MTRRKKSDVPACDHVWQYARGKIAGTPATLRTCIDCAVVESRRFTDPESTWKAVADET